MWTKVMLNNFYGNRGCMLSHFSCVLFYVTLGTIAHQASVHGILQARILEWISMPSSRESFWPRDWTHVSWVSCIGRWVLSVQFSSVAQSCPTLCDPMNCSTPGLPVHHQLPEFTQTHVHRVSDAIQPSHPRSSPSPPALNPSQHQSLFQWVNSSHEVAKVLEFQL